MAIASRPSGEGFGSPRGTFLKKIKWSENYYSLKLPTGLVYQECILIFDALLWKRHSQWIKKFPNRLKVKAGEDLKSVESFSQNIGKIVSLSSGISRSQLSIVVFGGGSVGDFGGFVASTLKRGVTLIQIPSTWLAAMDSAHGGKNALNVGGFKNQVGSIYLAKEIHLVKEVLQSLPETQRKDSLGEFYKTALLTGGQFWKKASQEKNPDFKFLWQQLPHVIHGKMKIVKADLWETKGLRHILNLGHTVGHVLESELHMAHGAAVHLGLLFSLNWGARLGLYRATNWEWLPSQEQLRTGLRAIKNPEALLLQDKKISAADEIQFVFVQRPGKAIVKKVKIKKLLEEWERQCR